MSYTLLFILMYWLFISLVLFVELSDRKDKFENYKTFLFCFLWPIWLPFAIYILELFDTEVRKRTRHLKNKCIHLIYTINGQCIRDVPPNWIVVHLGQNTKNNWECTLFNVTNGKYVSCNNEIYMRYAIDGAIKKAQGSDMESI